MKRHLRHRPCRLPLYLLGAAMTAPQPAPAQTNAGAAPSTGLTLDEVTDRQIADYRWDAAIAAYRAELARDPDNADAWRGLGRVLRWKGRLEESRTAYSRAAALDPDDPEAALGIAASYRYDRDLAEAARLYEAAATRWPDDEEVKQGLFQLRRERSPRLNLFYEDDLSFKTRSVGTALPFLSREEAYLEYQEEEREDIYTRKDAKAGLIHFFGLNHLIEFNVRLSDYKYHVPVSDYAAIDKFQEYRLKYVRPITPDQVATIRYTLRPTRLQTTGDTFNSHKLEAELRSQWSPRFATVIGTGLLRDLDEDAASSDDLRTTALVRAGVEYAVTTRFQVAANYITNPDLDNTINSTSLAQLYYSWNDTWSSLYRFRHDDYKRGDNQSAHYLGMRYAPGGHIWAEAGIKYVSRGHRNGFYPLASIVIRL